MLWTPTATPRFTWQRYTAAMRLGKHLAGFLTITGPSTSAALADFRKHVSVCASLSYGVPCSCADFAGFMLEWGANNAATDQLGRTAAQLAYLRSLPRLAVLLRPTSTQGVACENGDTMASEARSIPVIGQGNLLIASAR